MLNLVIIDSAISSIADWIHDSSASIKILTFKLLAVLQQASILSRTRLQIFFSLKFKPIPVLTFSNKSIGPKLVALKTVNGRADFPLENLRVSKILVNDSSIPTSDF